MVLVRKGGIGFGLLAGCVFSIPGEYEAFIPTTSELALCFFGALINVPLLLGVALIYHYIIPSIISNKWYMPHPEIPPFLVWSEPINFIHFCSIVFLAAGVSGVLLSVMITPTQVLIPVEIGLIGLGTYVGVRLVPSIYPKRVRYYV